MENEKITQKMLRFSVLGDRVALTPLPLSQKLVNAVNNLVEKDELVAWSRMKEERREHTITKLLHTVEQSALTLARNYETPTELEIKATDMGGTIIHTDRSSGNTHRIDPLCFFIPICFLICLKKRRL